MVNSKFFNKDTLKELLSSEPKVLNLPELSRQHFGRLRIIESHVPFECALIVPDNPLPKKLYVFLTAIGIAGKDYPIFHRASWGGWFQGISLCIDDPTRNLNKIAPTFYFGTKHENYLLLIKNIILKIKEIYNLNNSDITFISSSNGGFASISIANSLDYFNCIAFCPQFSVKDYFSNLGLFEETFDIKFENYESRLTLFDFVKNKKSKFFIYTNIACDSDRRQLDIFSQKINFKYTLGLQSVTDNIMLLVANINSKIPHLAQPDVFSCLYFECLLNDKLVTKKDKFACRSIIELMKINYLSKQ